MGLCQIHYEIITTKCSVSSERNCSFTHYSMNRKWIDPSLCCAQRSRPSPIHYPPKNTKSKLSPHLYSPFSSADWVGFCARMSWQGGRGTDKRKGPPQEGKREREREGVCDGIQRMDRHGRTLKRGSWRVVEMEKQKNVHWCTAKQSRTKLHPHPPTPPQTQTHTHTYLPW